MDYRVATGHGVALGSLTVISPQPTSAGLKATERTRGASGAVYEHAPYAELVWSYIETPSDYATLLGLFGLSSVLYANVTVYLRNANYSYARYNAVAVKPEIGRDGQWSNYFLRDVTILLTNLEAL